MLSFLIVSFLLVHSTHALQCVSNCSITNAFGVPFTIPDGQCQQRASLDDCGVSIDFRYDQRQYTVKFDNNWLASDYIYISPASYFSYEIRYVCSKDTNCVVSYAQSRVPEMVARNYSAESINRELEQYIRNPARNGPIQCYDLSMNNITCDAKSRCHMKFDMKEKKVTERGCDSLLGSLTTVYLFDGNALPSLTVDCNRDICNDDTTLTQVKGVLHKYGLTNADGRMIAGATKGFLSSLLMVLSLLFTVYTCFA